MLLPLAAAAPVGNWPFAILAISIAFIIFSITRLKMHPFLALIAAAFLAGFLTKSFPASTIQRLPAAMRADAEGNSWVAAIELTAVEFGSAAGAIAISIGLAAIIGLCLMESGGADKVVRRFLAVFGEKRAALALLTATYFLSIPIFFDTMFMLMVPLARALRLRTGKSYLLYILTICAAGVVTHSLTVPHPGPLAMVDNLRVDPGLSMFWGIAAGIIPVLIGYFFVKWMDRRMEVPLRETPGMTLTELEMIANKPESSLPSFLWSVAPVLLPIVLIGSGSLLKVGASYPGFVNVFGGPDGFASVTNIFSFIGNKNIALTLGAAIAMWVLARQRGFNRAQVSGVLEAPIATAAVIILITAAGGAFGAMLRHAGVGDAIKVFAVAYSIDLLILSWLTAFVIRIAQGSATVAMLTASAIIWPMIDPAANPALAYNPMYVFLAIGFGAFACSWMNDSGFWVVAKLSGLTEKEMLKTFTVMLTVISVAGLILTFVASRVLPLV
ncbi:MAG: hypothetical protein ABIZ81_02140 [Opitutaceae bacterium]